MTTPDSIVRNIRFSTNNSAVWALFAIGVAVSGYAAWTTWTTETASYRASYLAAADNRLLAVQHGVHELLSNLQGLGYAIEDRELTAVPALVKGFVPAGYQHGEIVVVDAEEHPVTRVCVQSCDGLMDVSKHELVHRAMLEAQLKQQPAATPPIEAKLPAGKYSTWLVFAIPLSTGRTLLAELDAHDLVESSLAYLRPGGVDVYFFDQTSSSELAYFHRSRKSKAPMSRDPRHPVWTSEHHTGTFQGAGRVWAVHNEPIRPISEQVGWAPWATLLFGLALTSAVTAALRSQIRMRRSVELEVERRTQSLQNEVEGHRRTQTELAAARDEAMESSRLKSAFLANVSHEIRTPLNGINGFASVLLESELDEEQREQAETIVHCATDLAALINDILDMSRIESGKIEIYPVETDLPQLLAECEASIRPQAEAKGLRVELWTAPSVPETVFLDDMRLKQVLRNLMTNAVKFTDEGLVRLSCSCDAAQLDGCLRFEVRDTGRGIPPEHRDRLFRRFRQVDGSFQRSHGGLGLGLAISRELVSLMGGKVGVESEPGRGSTFWVELPRKVVLSEAELALLSTTD